MHGKNLFKVNNVQMSIACEQSKKIATVLYLPSLFERKKKVKKTKWFMGVIKKSLLIIGEMTIGGLTGFITAAIVVPMVEEERGYKAIGGEWIILFVTTFFTIYFLHKFTRKRNSGKI